MRKSDLKTSATALQADAQTQGEKDNERENPNPEEPQQPAPRSKASQTRNIQQRGPKVQELAAERKRQQEA